MKNLNKKMLDQIAAEVTENLNEVYLAFSMLPKAFTLRATEGEVFGDMLFKKEGWEILLVSRPSKTGFFGGYYLTLSTRVDGQVVGETSPITPRRDGVYTFKYIQERIYWLYRRINDNFRNRQYWEDCSRSVSELPAQYGRFRDGIKKFVVLRPCDRLEPTDWKISYKGDWRSKTPTRVVQEIEDRDKYIDLNALPMAYFMDNDGNYLTEWNNYIYIRFVN